MAPLQTLLWSALFTGAGASDEMSLLQKKGSAASIQKEGAHAKGLHLLETAQTLIAKVNAGDDPTQCGVVSDAVRTAIEEALPAILQQHTHYQNEINSAAQLVDNCPGDDLVQQDTNLDTLRQDHSSCRLTQQELQDSLQPCHQYEQLRSPNLNRCFNFPDEESGYPDAVQQVVDELQFHRNEAAVLRDACSAARDALAHKQEECAAAQSVFEETFCTYRSNCAGAQVCRSTTEDAYNQIRAEVEAAVISLQSEYELFKHVECLLGHADDAIEQQSTVAGDEVAACSEELEQLPAIEYPPALQPLVSCEDTVLYHPPCEADFFDAEYADLPQRVAIEAACTSCPSLPHSVPQGNDQACPDPAFPHHIANGGPWCYTDASHAAVNSGPCDSWCITDPTDPRGDGCNGCCGPISDKVCASQHLAAVGTSSRQYNANPSVGTWTPGPWTLIIQYGTEGTYTPSSDAVGVPSENEAGFAKLSDVRINSLPGGGDTSYNYYWLTSDGENPSIMIRTASTRAYVDTEPSPFVGADLCASAQAFTHPDQCDTWTTLAGSYFNAWGAGNNCNRWFQFASRQCYRPASATERCYSHGQGCQLYGQSNHAPRRNVKIFKFTAQ